MKKLLMLVTSVFALFSVALAAESMTSNQDRPAAVKKYKKKNKKAKKAKVAKKTKKAKKAKKTEPAESTDMNAGTPADTTMTPPASEQPAGQ